MKGISRGSLRLSQGGKRTRVELDQFESNTDLVHLATDALGMGVGDKNLTVVMQTNLVEEIVHPLFIQFFEYIVEQQERGEAFCFFERFVFRELKREKQAFPLALRGHGLEGHAGKADLDIVAVDADAGSLQVNVLFEVLAEQVTKGCFQEGAFITEA